MVSLPFSPHRTRGPPQPYHRQPGASSSRRGCRRPPLRFCVLWAAFSFVLLAVYLLRHDVLRQPDAARWIGWQAHERITRPHAAPAASELGALASPADASPEAWGADPQHDFDLSFPLDVYAPLLPNPAPLVDMTVHSCFPLSPAMCMPPSDEATDRRLGRWVRVDRPLDPEAALQLGAGSGGGVLSKVLGGLESRYIFYRRSRRANVPRVVDLRIVHAGQEAPLEPGWKVITNDLTTSMQRMLGTAKSAHLWFRVLEAPQTAKADEMEGIGRRQEKDSQGRPVVSQGASWADDAAQAITEIDIKVRPDGDRRSHVHAHAFAVRPRARMARLYRGWRSVSANPQSLSRLAASHDPAAARAAAVDSHRAQLPHRRHVQDHAGRRHALLDDAREVPRHARLGRRRLRHEHHRRHAGILVGPREA
jgi:hypothetical protein